MSRRWCPTSPWATHSGGSYTKHPTLKSQDWPVSERGVSCKPMRTSIPFFPKGAKAIKVLLTRKRERFSRVLLKLRGKGGKDLCKKNYVRKISSNHCLHHASPLPASFYRSGKRKICISSSCYFLEWLSDLYKANGQLKGKTAKRLLKRPSVSRQQRLGRKKAFAPMSPSCVGPSVRT